SAASSAMVIRLRSRRVRPGRDHTEPQAPSVMKSRKSALKALRLASERATWAAPSTALRVCRPSLRRASPGAFSVKVVLPREVLDKARHGQRPLDAGQVARALNHLVACAGDEVGQLAYQRGRRGAVLGADDTECRHGDALRRLGEIGIAD